MTNENLKFFHFFWGGDWLWRVWCGMKRLQRITQLPFDPSLCPHVVKTVAACLLRDQQNDLKICHLDKAWKRKEARRVVIFSWLHHLTQASTAESFFCLFRVASNSESELTGKWRTPSKIDVSFLHGIFSNLGTAAYVPQLRCSCEMTATSVRGCSPQIALGEITFFA